MNTDDDDKKVLASDRNRELKSKYGITFTAFADIEKAPHKKHLVRKYLGAGELSCMFGPPGSAKSVLASDLAAHVAWGRNWFDRGTMQGGVLFVAAERAALVKRRLAAFRLCYGQPELPLAVISGSIDLRTNSKGADGIIDCAKRLADASGMETRLIVGDTVSRLLAGGDENSPKDVGAFIGNVARVQDATGAHVLLLHHVPHEQNRMRGHGALLAACDTTIRVEKSGGVRTATIDKNNDGEEGERVAFNLESFELGKDPETGEMTTAPIVRPIEGDIPKAQPARKLAPRYRLAFDALADVVTDKGRPTPASFALPAGIKTVVELDRWRDELFARGIIEREDTNPRETFRRIKIGLQARKMIGERDAHVWLASA